MRIGCRGLPGGGLLSACLWQQDTPPAVSCGAYVVMDADTGQILIEQNPDQKMYPASTTKIMTLGLTAQKTGGNWDESVTVSEEAVYSLLHTDSSHIALQPGEVVPIERRGVRHAAASANDGANVLAAYIGGSIQGGVGRDERPGAGPGSDRHPLCQPARPV